MEPEGSLPQSQVPATCPYPEPARSIPCPHILLSIINYKYPNFAIFPASCLCFIKFGQLLGWLNNQWIPRKVSATCS